MEKVFFGKMNDPAQVEEKVYRTPNRDLLGDIEIGDYAFIRLEKETKPASTKRLWKLRSIQEETGKYAASFEEICQFEPIPLSQFKALDLFVLSMNLLNKCDKQTKGLSFINISLTDAELFSDLASRPDQLRSYLADANHYRKIIRLESKEQLSTDTIHVQFYKEGDSWLLADAGYIGDDLKDKYDAGQFDLYKKYGEKGNNTQKEKMYSFLAGNDSIVPPLVGLWDLFCGTVIEKGETKKPQTTSNKRYDFIEYCKENGVVRTADSYESAIRSMEKEMSKNIDDEFDKDNCASLIDSIDKYAKSLDASKIGGRRNWISYVKKYVEYKKTLVVADPLSFELNEETPIAYISYDFSQAKHEGINKVFYGTPGCGKSFYLEHIVLSHEGIDENSVFRTTFFQDYTYTDFVGQILPTVDTDGSVTYEFNPGPFTLALKCAIDNPEEKVALIIEELNRGNAPSIFGDIFQLLDRSRGTSIYSIVNVNIQSYLKKESPYDLGYIKIPANLYIFATMNTSDQNVYTLDTAFKRRWKFEKLTNDFLGTDTIGKRFVPGLQNTTWKKFVETINSFILSHATSLSAEDKQLGKYFVDSELLAESADDYSDEALLEFAYKVFEYLWTDVAKFNRSDWFVGEVKSLDILIYRFMSHENVFTSELASALPVCVPSEEVE